MKKLFVFSSIMAIIIGSVMMGGGGWGLWYTYSSVSREMITTPDDAAVPGIPVRGPLSLKVQADTMRMHVLRITGGKTYAEMPRQVQKLDESGNPILGEDGQPVMVANTSRDIWVTAMTLITALNLGIITYAFFGLVTLLGLVFVWVGIVFHMMSRQYA